MKLSWEQIQAKALAFSKKWKDASREEADAQNFEREFLQVFGIDDPYALGEHEHKVPLDDGHTGYIDYFWAGHIAIEMKSSGKNLTAAYEQLKNYVIHLSAEDMPELLMVSDFRRIELVHRTTGQTAKFLTKDLHKHIRHFAKIAGYESSRVREEELSVNVHAAEKAAQLHDSLKEYGYTGHDLEIYLVRLLFCFFAEDSGLFPQGSFHDLVENSAPDGSNLAERLARLFQVLNTSQAERTKKTLLPQWLLQFQYVNGGLFAVNLPLAEFNAKMRQTLLDCCDFDWSRISPAIFGAMFQGVMDKQARRELGAHYTSEENILKVIRPLFLDELWEEFERVKASPQKLDAFHEKISRLKFLDPACGCGNFLIIAYRELRLLELEILKMKIPSFQLALDIGQYQKVSVSQFFGMDIEDFPCQIAQVGMWLMDHLMNRLVSREFGLYYVRLPLTVSAKVVCCDALKTDWESVIPAGELSYIFGNPPFAGSKMQNEEQRGQVAQIFSGVPNSKILDFVCCWYKHAADIMLQNPSVRSAFVATNSICQGEQVAPLWEPLFDAGFHIDFAHRTFRWSNEGRGMAAVHCVIVGFSRSQGRKPLLFSYPESGNEPQVESPSSISPYLTPGEAVFLTRRSNPLCDVPRLRFGNMPLDGGNLILSGEEKNDLLESHPQAEKFIRRFMGADEFINSRERWCLWLVGADPAELSKIPPILERIKAVKAFRLASVAPSTQAKAAAPGLFRDTNQPTEPYLVVPKVSSERRAYIPIGFVSPDVVASDLLFIVEHVSHYHFGILSSSVHMAWMRAVGGRLKSDYRYSKDFVYNCFPWPDINKKEDEKISEAAKRVLEIRAKYPHSSLAVLYNPETMPPDLAKAHIHLDRLVLNAYGMKSDTAEPAVVASLMQRYQALTS